MLFTSTSDLLIDCNSKIDQCHAGSIWSAAALCRFYQTAHMQNNALSLSFALLSFAKAAGGCRTPNATRVGIILFLELWNAQRR